MTIQRTILILAALLLVACSKNESSGNSASGGGSGGTSSLAEELCPDACKTVKTCYAALDSAACEAQCGKELAGNGYLIPEFAKEYFQKLKDIGTDPNCKVTNLETWILDEDAGAGVNDPNAMKTCIDGITKCTGSAPTGNTCFISYYIYNTQIRKNISACYDLDCASQSSCACDATVPWRAWVAIPVDPSDPVHGVCPPSG